MNGSGNSAVLDRGAGAAPSEARRLNNLAEIARLIGSSSDLPAVLNRIVVAVCQHSSWSSCGIMGVNRRARLSELIVRFDPRLDPATNPPTSWKLEQSATMRVIETNRVVIIEDAQVCDEFLAYKEDSLLRGYRTVVIQPLGNTDHLGREMTIAVHSREKIAVSGSELAFLSTVTQLASIAVEKAKRVQLEQDRAQRLRDTIEISSLLMERVLAEGSMDAVVEMVAAVLPYPLIIADMAAGTFSARRSPVPKSIGEPDWKRLVSHELAPDIAALLRSCTSGGAASAQALAVRHNGSTIALRTAVELLQVHGETVGGLIIFPPGEGLDDLDGMVAKAAKLALNVQVMRDHVRFQSEASSLTEIFKTLFAGAPRHPGELIARAQRLGAQLPGPARLIGIGLCNEGTQTDDGPSAGLHLSLSRVAAALRPGAAVVVDDDLIVFAPVSAREEPARWAAFVAGLLNAVETHTGARAIAAESPVCRRLSDYREARIACRRVMALAKMFGRSGRLAQADFGPFAVLLSAVDQSSARDFVKHTLGAIEDHDARNGGELLPTLMQFVRTGCRYQACADQLGIHVSTLRYRLRRLQDLFAVDFEDPDKLFGLTLALRLRDLAAPPSG